MIIVFICSPSSESTCQQPPRPYLQVSRLDSSPEHRALCLCCPWLSPAHRPQNGIIYTPAFPTTIYIYISNRVHPLSRYYHLEAARLFESSVHPFSVYGVYVLYCIRTRATGGIRVLYRPPLNVHIQYIYKWITDFQPVECAANPRIYTWNVNKIQSDSINQFVCRPRCRHYKHQMLTSSCGFWDW